MKLEKHIANLLYRHQCVVVPGFGAFLSEWHSAKIIENQNSFFPPKKLISFNQLIKTNDGLLASHIAKEENITYEAATILINSTAVFWSEKLNHKEVLYLENIGEIIENQENNWVFKPNLNHNFLTESFGLSSFNSPEIVRNNGNVSTFFEQETNAKPVILLNENTEELVFESEQLNTNTNNDLDTKVVSLNNTIQRSNQVLKYVASVAIIGCMSVYGLKFYNEYSFRKNQQVAVANAKKQVTKKLQEAGIALPNFTETLILQNEITEIPNNNTEVNITVTTENKIISIDLKKPFQVIAGSFQSVRRSNILVSELEKLGYKTQISHPKNGIYRVVLASFTTEAEAETYKNEVAKNKTYKDTWVLK